MENQFQQNKDFNQAHREDKDRVEKGPQGKEGDPNQRFVKREELDTDEKELDRRPPDVSRGNVNSGDGETSSAIAGIHSDNQNATDNNSKPLGEDPNHNAEVENKEDKDDGITNE